MSTDAAVDQPILRVEGLHKVYESGRSWSDRLARRPGPQLSALDGVDLQLQRGEVLSVVGESGSGKSTLAKIIVGSETPSRGSVSFEGQELPRLRDRRSIQRIQMVFQDPYSSLNPRLTIGSVLGELLRVHDVVPRGEIEAESVRLLNLVGLEADALRAYPSQFSGGQRQRIAIARALVARPEVLIADEPVSALDVSVQATILDLFAKLRDELGLSVLFIAHNLAVVQHLSQRVAVMYLGRIVEVGTAADLFANPRHPYTRALIASIPRMSRDSINSAFEVEGEPPSPFDIPQGCRFHPRCVMAEEGCRRQDPVLAPVERGHSSACLRAHELAEPGQIVPLDATR